MPGSGVSWHAIFLLLGVDWWPVWLEATGPDLSRSSPTEPAFVRGTGAVQGHVRNGPTCVARGICAHGGRAFRMVLTMTGGDLAPGELVLRGRRDECAVLDVLLDGARNGQSGVLVLRGEAGVGKTALVEYAIESAAGLTVLHAAGCEAEVELAFAALHQLCAPVLDRLDGLPGPQRNALATTFGLSAGAVPDRFFVALAVLGLLSEAAEKRPLLCVIDDAQWLDRASAQALAFVARRMLAERVVMLFAAREPSDLLAGLPELVLEGLGAADARALLASVIPGRLDE